MIKIPNTYEPCECYESDCEECSLRAAEQQDEAEMMKHYRFIGEQEEAEFQRQLEGGDDDDWDEEDLHGSHPIDEPDEEDEDDNVS